MRRLADERSRVSDHGLTGISGFFAQPDRHYGGTAAPSAQRLEPVSGISRTRPDYLRMMISEYSERQAETVASRVMTIEVPFVHRCGADDLLVLAKEEREGVRPGDKNM